MPELNPETLHGISFYDAATRSQMRYIYPNAGHWCAGWILRETRGGQWETYRKANDQDIASLCAAVSSFLMTIVEIPPPIAVKAHHGEHDA